MNKRGFITTFGYCVIAAAVAICAALARRMAQ